MFFHEFPVIIFPKATLTKIPFGRVFPFLCVFPSLERITEFPPATIISSLRRVERFAKQGSPSLVNPRTKFMMSGWTLQTDSLR